MSIPVIGQKPVEKDPLANIAVEVDAQGAKVSIVMLGGISTTTVRMSPQELGQFMVYCGNALNTMVPGALVQHLRHWLASVEEQERQASQVLSKIGIRNGSIGSG